MESPSYNGYRFPAEVIDHAVWLYHRFPLSFREVEWTLSPFLVAASSGLSEEALSDEASEAAAGDVDGRLVGGHAEEFVQLTGSGVVNLSAGGLVEGASGCGGAGWRPWFSPPWAGR
ncbi:hypothetical protein PV684_53180, partial [Streptomyces sp. AK02-04a]|nr:hypothetical protein [Streptomyces sp. AK02-04a]